MQGVQGSSILEVQLVQKLAVWEKEAELGELFGSMLRFELAVASFQACLASMDSSASVARSLQIHVLAKVATLQMSNSVSALPERGADSMAPSWQIDDALLVLPARTPNGIADYKGQAVAVQNIRFNASEGNTAAIESQQTQQWHQATTIALSLKIQHTLKDLPFIPTFVGVSFAHRDLKILHSDHSAEGELLSDFLMRGAPGRVIYHVLLELLKALDRLSRERVAYLNIRPENVLLLGEGTKIKIKLLRWDNARLMDRDGAVACNASAPDWDPVRTPPEATNLQR
jgi:hypothetical protein